MSILFIKTRGSLVVECSLHTHTHTPWGDHPLGCCVNYCAAIVTILDHWTTMNKCKIRMQTCTQSSMIIIIIGRMDFPYSFVKWTARASNQRSAHKWSIPCGVKFAYTRKSQFESQLLLSLLLRRTLLRTENETNTQFSSFASITRQSTLRRLILFSTFKFELEFPLRRCTRQTTRMHFPKSCAHWISIAIIDHKNIYGFSSTAVV